MHFNENSSRPQAVTSTGTAQFRVSYPKARKGEGVAKEVKVNATYGKYIFNFLKYILTSITGMIFIQLSKIIFCLYTCIGFHFIIVWHQGCPKTLFFSG